MNSKYSLMIITIVSVLVQIINPMGSPTHYLPHPLVKRGDSFGVSNFLRHIDTQRYDVNTPDQHGNTLLHEMASDTINPTKWARAYLIKSYIEKNGNINAINNRGESVFMTALCRGNFNFALLLLRFGVKTTGINNKGRSGLHLIFYHKISSNILSNSIVKCYDLSDWRLDCIEQVNRSIDAVAYARPFLSLYECALERIAWLEADTFIKKVFGVQSIASLDTQTDCEKHLPDTMFPEAVFARLRRTDMNLGQCEHILSIIERIYESPTHEIQQFLHDLAKCMIAYSHKVSGWEVNRGDNHGNTPLHYACRHGAHYDLLVHLIDRGADVTKKNNKGECPAGLLRASGACKCHDCVHKTGMECSSLSLLCKHDRLLDYIGRRRENIENILMRLEDRITSNE